MPLELLENWLDDFRLGLGVAARIVLISGLSAPAREVDLAVVDERDPEGE